MSRKTARDIAFKLIFEIPFYQVASPCERIEFFFENTASDEMPENEKQYITTLVTNCFDNLEEIDKKISSSLENWKIERLSKVDLSILRLACTEILFMEDIPYKVSVNEAVELGQTYGEDKTSKFINGVLSKIQ